MPASMNKVILIGRLGKDPEIKYTQSGKAVANLSLATDESYKSAQGEKVSKTEWHNLVVWGPSVENFIEKYLHKGDLIYAEGKLQTRSWEDKKDGTKRFATEIVVFDIRPLQTSRQDDAQPSKPRTASKASSRPAQTSQKAAPARTRAASVFDEDDESTVAGFDEDSPF